MLYVLYYGVFVIHSISYGVWNILHVIFVYYILYIIWCMKYITHYFYINCSILNILFLIFYMLYTIYFILYIIYISYYMIYIIVHLYIYVYIYIIYEYIRISWINVDLGVSRDSCPSCFLTQIAVSKRNFEKGQARWGGNIKSWPWKSDFFSHEQWPVDPGYLLYTGQDS